jgi:Transcriptional regulator
MPKSLSENERSQIKKRLLEEAAACLSQYGIKKTTVDELVKRVNIPKGTFYLFYESKEHLIFDVFLALHEEYQQKLKEELAPLKEEIDPEILTEIFFSMYLTFDNSLMLKLLTSGELEIYFRRLPPDLIKQHTEMDDFRVEEIISMIPGLKSGKIQLYSAAMRGVFIALMHKKEIGEEIFDDALRVMIKGVVIQMFDGD